MNTYLANTASHSDIWCNTDKTEIDFTLPHRANVTTKYILYFRPISKYHKARYNVKEFTVLKHMHISIKKKMNRSLLNINSFHVHLENSKYKILLTCVISSTATMTVNS